MILVERRNTMICAHCKKEIDDKYDRCPNCGRIFVKEAQLNDDTEKIAVYCDNCGAAVQPGDIFCANCGERLAYQSAEKPVYEEAMLEKEKKKISKRFLLSALAVSIVLLFAVSAFALGWFKSDVERFKEYEKFVIFDSLKSICVSGIENERRLIEEGYSTSVDIAIKDISTKLPIPSSYFKVFENISVDADTKFDEEHRALLAGVDVEAGGVKLDILTTVEEDAIGIYLPELSDKLYKLDKNDADRLNIGIESFEIGKYSEEEIKAFIDKYAEIMLSAVKKDKLLTEKKQALLPISENELGCKVYTLELGSEDIADVLEKAASELQASEKERDMLEYIIGPALYRSFAVDSLIERIAEDSKAVVKEAFEGGIEIELCEYKSKAVCQRISYKASGNDTDIYIESYADLAKFGIFGYRYENNSSVSESYVSYKINDKKLEGEIRHSFGFKYGDGAEKENVSFEFESDLSDVDLKKLIKKDFSGVKVEGKLNINGIIDAEINLGYMDSNIELNIDVEDLDFNGIGAGEIEIDVKTGIGADIEYPDDVETGDISELDFSGIIRQITGQGFGGGALL